MNKSAYEIYRGTLDEIRAAGTYKQERVITTPQGARIDTTKTSGVITSYSIHYTKLYDVGYSASPARHWMSSATMLTAISSGVCALMDRPMGQWQRVV